MISESDIEEPTPKPAHPISPIEVSTSQLTSTDVSFESTVKVYATVVRVCPVAVPPK